MKIAIFFLYSVVISRRIDHSVIFPVAYVIIVANIEITYAKAISTSLIISRLVSPVPDDRRKRYSMAIIKANLSIVRRVNRTDNGFHNRGRALAN